MNRSPLIPQGSFLDRQTARGRSGMGTAVLIVVALHVVLLGGLLIQGCRSHAPALDESAAATNQTTTLPTNPPETLAANPSNTLPDTLPPLPSATNPPPVSELPAVTPEVAAPAAPAPTGSEKTYRVAKGDTLAKIAHAQHLSVHALVEANPGVTPAKLKVGQSLRIPGAGAVRAKTADSTATDATVYVVKSGDSLAKVAKRHGVSVRSLKELNHLKSDRIVVGQRLNLPTSSQTARKEGARELKVAGTN